MKLREMLMVLAALASLFSEGDSGSECTVQKDDPCKCSTNNTAIDLTQVFIHIPVNLTVDDDQYVYSPCKSTTFHSATTKPALVWQIKKTEKTGEKKYNALGREANISWIINSTKPLQFQITYSGGDPYDGKTLRSAVFYYQHSPNATQMVYMGKFAGQKYMFQVTGNTVAPQSWRSVTKTSHVAVGVVGLVIIILTLVTMATYCVVGVVYNYKVRGQGGTDLIPNNAFWRELPLLVKDGCCFTIRPCTSRFHGDYQKL